jgi:hypothetical protein
MWYHLRHSNLKMAKVEIKPHLKKTLAHNARDFRRERRLLKRRSMEKLSGSRHIVCV